MIFDAVSGVLQSIDFFTFKLPAHSVTEILFLRVLMNSTALKNLHQSLLYILKKIANYQFKISFPIEVSTNNKKINPIYKKKN